MPNKGEAGGSSGKRSIVARLTELNRQFVRHDWLSAEELASSSTSTRSRSRSVAKNARHKSRISAAVKHRQNPKRHLGILEQRCQLRV
jgi:hypothetical protein